MKSNLYSLAVKKETASTLMVLLAIVVAAPFINQQLISGTIVNAALIVGVCLLGARDGLIIGLIPSSVALATGLLPPVLAPIIPFIIVSNAILVLAFDYLRKLNYWVGIVVSALLKSVFLYCISNLVIGLLLNKHVAPTVAMMTSWPQLVTALAGGIVAFGVVKLLKRDLRA